MYIKKKLLIIAAAALLGSITAFPAYAETISGKLETADSDSIDGWAWNSEDFDHIVDIELQLTREGTEEVVKTLAAKADNYREDLHTSIKDGWHGFSCPIDWNTLDGNAFTITAYVVTKDNRTKLPEVLTYNKIPLVEPIQGADAAAIITVEAPAPEAAVPAAEPTEAPKTAPEEKPTEAPKATVPAETAAAASDPKTNVIRAGSSKKNTEYGPGTIGPGFSSARKGDSLGIFKTTGYCSCSHCSDGHNLTYSGTVPKAGHTIAADISILPLGTKVVINDVVYTVEDIGSSVTGNKIDIFYSSHQAAWNHGVQEAEVFLAK